MLLSIILQAATGAALGKAGIAIAAAAAAFAAALGIGRIGKSALDAAARQPEYTQKYQMVAIIVGALVEGACLFAILVCLLGILN
ncbi:MAG: F0F1 ATP synthase subunit C [Candidatus Cryptobacteroides sp.]